LGKEKTKREKNARCRSPKRKGKKTDEIKRHGEKKEKEPDVVVHSRNKKKATLAPGHPRLLCPVRSDSCAARTSSVSCARFQTHSCFFHIGVVPVSSRSLRRLTPASSTIAPHSLCLLPTPPVAACASTTRRWPRLGPAT
jgi:hypothetical protein